MKRSAEKESCTGLRRISAFFPVTAAISVAAYVLALSAWAVFLNDPQAISSGGSTLPEKLIRSRTLFFYIITGLFILFVFAARWLSGFVPEKASGIITGKFLSPKAQNIITAVLTAAACLLMADRFFVKEMSDYGAAPGLFYVHKADAGTLIILFTAAILGGIALKGRKLPKGVLYGGYSAAAVLTYYSLLYTNPFRVDALHTIAYINSIVNCVMGAPFDEFTSSTYGHYGILYIPLVKLLGSNTDAIVSVISLLGVLVTVMVIYVCHNVTDNDYVRLIAVFASIITIATMRYTAYWQCQPHRVLFPLILCAYMIYISKHDKYSAGYELLGFFIAMLSIVWNTEEGLFCTAALAAGFIVHKWQECCWREKKFLLYCLKMFLLASAALAGSIITVNIYNLICGGKLILKEFFYPLYSGMVIASFDEFILGAPIAGNNAWIYVIVLFAVLLAVSMRETTFFSLGGGVTPDKNAPAMCFTAIVGLLSVSYYTWRAAYYNLDIVIQLAAAANLFIFSKFSPVLKSEGREKSSVSDAVCRAMAIVCYTVLACLGAQIVFASPALKAKSENGYLKRNGEIEHYSYVIETTVPDDVFVIGQGANLLWLELDRQNCGKYRDIGDLYFGNIDLEGKIVSDVLEQDRFADLAFVGLEFPLEKILEKDPSYRLISSAEVGPASSTMTISFYSRSIQDTAEYRFAKQFADSIGYEADAESLKNLARAFAQGDRAAAAAVMSEWTLASQTADLSNEDFVTLMCQIILGRPPEVSADRGWIDAMNGGISKPEVIYTFVLSEESANYRQLC